MWTRASSITSCVIDWDHEEEVGSGASSEDGRFHHRGSGSNHQPGERDSRLLQDEESSALGQHIEALRRDDSLIIHHDQPNPPGACKLKKRSLPSSSRTRFLACSHSLRSSMSSPEISTRVRQPRQQQSQSHSRGSRSLEESICVSSKDFQQLDDMQTQIGIATPAESSADQEVPEVVLPSTSPSKRRRLVYCNEELNLQAPASGTRSCEEDSGLSSQHMADLDRASKASTPEDIDSEPPPGASELGLVSQCTTTTATTISTTTTTPPGNLLNVAEQETTVVVEPLQILEQLHFSRHDDTTPSQFVPHISRVLPPDCRISSTQTSRTMADEWLQLSLGQSYDEHNQQPRSATTSTTAPMQFASPDPPGFRDFFSSEASSSHRQQQISSSPYRPRPAYSSESSKQVVTVPRPLFLEPRPPRGVASEQFRGSFIPPQFSNLQYPPVRVLQPVRTEQSTETTAVHAWRSPNEAAPGPSSHGYGAAAASSSSSAPWMREPAPNPGAEFLSMGTPRDYNYRMPPFSSMQQQPQGVDPEQAWRNLLQRVGNNMNVPVGTGFPASRAPMLPLGDHSEEHMDALKRAVERFQGADQEPLTELQRLQRRGQQQPAGPSSYDPNTDISLASFYGGGGSAAHGGPSSSSRPRAAAQPASAHRRIILRPHAPRPGLWFTLQAFNSQPEASPLQQIPTAYIRVVDDTMTVAAVRRYLANKLGLASEDEVELACKGQLLQATLSLHQVRDGIWQSPNTNTPSPHPNTHQLLSEGKAWKAPDGSITLVGDVVMVLTYSHRPQQQQQHQQSQEEEEQALLPVTSS